MNDPPSAEIDLVVGKVSKKVCVINSISKEEKTCGSFLVYISKFCWGVLMMVPESINDEWMGGAYANFQLPNCFFSINFLFV